MIVSWLAVLLSLAFSCFYKDAHGTLLFPPALLPCLTCGHSYSWPTWLQKHLAYGQAALMPGTSWTYQDFLPIFQLIGHSTCSVSCKGLNWIVQELLDTDQNESLPPKKQFRYASTSTGRDFLHLPSENLDCWAQITSSHLTRKTLQNPTQKRRSKVWVFSPFALQKPTPLTLAIRSP